MKKYFSLAVCLSLVLLLTPNIARADSLVANFNSTDVGAFGSPNYGTVQLDLVGSTIKITIDLADGNGFNVIDTGGHHAFTFNGNLGGAVTMSSFSDVRYYDSLGGGGNSPFGSFDYAVDSTCTNGGGCGLDSFSFVVSRVGGFSSVGNLVRSNGSAYFAADIANGNGATGVVGATGGVPPIVTTPEPWSVLTLGVAFLGFGYITRKHGFSYTK